MKKLLVLVFVLSLFNCKSDKAKKRLNALVNFENTLLKEYRLTQDSVIYFESEKGLKLKFVPNDLEGYTGGNLTLQLTELNSTQELLLANAQTVSNGKWLVSGGAFNINILNKDGNVLSLKKDKTITVDFKLNATENDMEIFYGEVDDTDMNWQPTNVEVNDKELFFIAYKDSTITDKKLTKKYGGINIGRSAIVIDTFGILPYELMKTEIEKFLVYKDTLRIYQRYFSSEELGEALDSEIISITRKQSDSIIDFIYNLDIIEGSNELYTITRKPMIVSRSRIEEVKVLDFKKLIEERKEQEKINTFYNTIELPKLGWINIDKYAKIENKETISFKFNDEFDAKKLTLIDKDDNTLLNFYEDSIELPVDKTFIVIAFGLKEDTTYGFKKTFRVTKDATINLDLKKVSKGQIKALMTIK